MTRTHSQKPNLYEEDFLAWCEKTATQLKNQDFANLDFANLIEEIEALGRSERRELRNRLGVFLSHLLKRSYIESPENFRGWDLTIVEQRQQIANLLRDSPRLKPYFEESLLAVYRDALELVVVEYPQIEFPSNYPFDRERENLLSQTYWQEDEN
ncbi:MAG: DUF29 domain-containing protein [Spirulina sp.]